MASSGENMEPTVPKPVPLMRPSEIFTIISFTPFFQKLLGAPILPTSWHPAIPFGPLQFFRDQATQLSSFNLLGIYPSLYNPAILIKGPTALPVCFIKWATRPADGL